MRHVGFDVDPRVRGEGRVELNDVVENGRVVLFARLPLDFGDIFGVCTAHDDIVGWIRGSYEGMFEMWFYFIFYFFLQLLIDKIGYDGWRPFKWFTLLDMLAKVIVVEKYIVTVLSII